MFKDRGRLRCRAPISDIGHLFKLSRTLGTIKMPSKISSGYGQYAQLIIDSQELCSLLRSYGWDSLPSDKLDSRHTIRGLLDGGGSVCRNGNGIQSRYRRITFNLKDISLLKWIMSHLGNRKICKHHISWVGARANEILKLIYLNQSICLGRKLRSAELFSVPVASPSGHLPIYNSYR